MAGENDFLAFATGGSANVESQSAYAADPVLATGEETGLANPQRSNKAWRQSSSMAAMIGSFISNENFNAVDNGNISQLLTAFEDALLAYLGNNFFNISQSGGGLNPIVIKVGGFIIVIGVTPTMASDLDTIQVSIGTTFTSRFIFGVCADSGPSCWSYGVFAGSDLSHITVQCNTNQVVPDMYGGVGTGPREVAVGYYIVVGI
jgi:hypothetical protein